MQPRLCTLLVHPPSVGMHSPHCQKAGRMVHGSWFMQMGSAQRLPGLFSASSHSPYWRLVRKGVAPAFNPKNLRWGPMGRRQEN